MPVKLSGMASGLPPNLVDQLVEIEKLPIKTVQEKKSKVENRLKLVTELEGYLRDIGGTLGELATAKGFTALKVDSADKSIIDGTVEPGSGVKGSWNLEVLQLASKSGAMSNPFPDKDDTQVGIGYLSFDTSDGTKEVFIDSNNSTLEGVARAINFAGIGVRASVVQDRADGDGAYRLMITGMGYGDDDYVKFPTLYFLDGDQDFYFDKENEAQNAKVKVDGFEIELPDNKIDSLADGLVLDIRQAAPGKIVNVKVSEDQEVVVGKIETFVESMNNVLHFIQNQNRLTADSDTTNNLGGDSILRTVETDIRRIIQEPVNGTGRINRLAQLGIRFTRDGVLEFNKEMFHKSLVQDSDGTRRFLVGDGFSTGFI
ncbi:MAG: flagellar filament capping protein FliD, partial [Bdellovibrionales bacterium]|nr:flagellar filament capping protein FliD [Bdellovibrionales bacterium]